MNEMRKVEMDGEEADQLLRCPYAWYKKINYETGEIDLKDTRILQDTPDTVAARVASRLYRMMYWKGGTKAPRGGGVTTSNYLRGNRRKKTRKKNPTKKKSRKRHFFLFEGVCLCLEKVII